MTLASKLAKVQNDLHAPKGQFNKFGGYSYRNCEDILQAVKPLLGDLIITITDDIVLVGDRVYVKATATITDGKESISTTAFAREAASKKGMDDSQLTGATSSYARKYALNGLLLIDDNKDADSMDNRQQAQQQAPQQAQQAPKQGKPLVVDNAVSAINGAADAATVNNYVMNAQSRATQQQMQTIQQAATQRLEQLEGVPA